MNQPPFHPADRSPCDPAEHNSRKAPPKPPTMSPSAGATFVGACIWAGFSAAETAFLSEALLTDAALVGARQYLAYQEWAAENLRWD